jgi:hypothetical protein
MTRPQDLVGEKVRDTELGEAVRVERVEELPNRLGDGVVELRRPDGSTYFAHYLELGFNLDGRFAPPADMAASDD